MTLFGALSIVAILCIIIFSGLSIEDFSNFFNDVFGFTQGSSAEVQNVQGEEVKKLLTSNEIESNKDATNEVENKKVLSNKQRLFNWSVLLGFILLILFGIIFFTGTSVPENVDSTVIEAVAQSADDSSASSYSEEYSDEFYAWCEAEGISPNREAAPVTEPKTFKRVDGFLDEDSLD